MKLERNFAGISALSLALLLAACGGKALDSCGGTIPKPFEYIITQYTTKLVRYPQAIVEESVLVTPEALGAQPVDWKAFSIEINARFQTYTSARMPVLQFSLFEQALACSPAEIAHQKLTKISITSAHNFSDKYPAGSELAGLFATIYPVQKVNSLSAIPAPRELKFKLLEAPQYASQNFAMSITLDDGSVYLLQTGDVYFTVP
jgi:hypothetical protein